MHAPIPGVWNKPREFVWTYVGANEWNTHTFSARPVAGTQDNVKDEDILSYQLVPDNTEIMMPRIFRGEWPKDVIHP